MGRWNAVKVRSKGERPRKRHMHYADQNVPGVCSLSQRRSFNCITMHEVDVAGRAYGIEWTVGLREGRTRARERKRNKIAIAYGTRARKRDLQTRRTSLPEETKKTARRWREKRRIDRVKRREGTLIEINCDSARVNSLRAI